MTEEQQADDTKPGQALAALGVVLALVGFVGTILVWNTMANPDGFDGVDYSAVDKWLGVFAGVTVIALGVIVVGIGAIVKHLASRP